VKTTNQTRAFDYITSSFD